MKKRFSVLICLVLALVLSLTFLSFSAGESAAEKPETENAETADIGLEAQFASSWEGYSVRSSDYLMLILTIHADLELVSIRRADNGEILPWRPSITRSMKNNDGVVTEKTWVIGIEKAEAALDAVVAFSDGSEYPIPRDQEAESKEADGSLLGTWSGDSYGGNWFFRFTENTFRMARSDDPAALDQEGKYTELPLIWRGSGTVWVVITDENRLPILEMNDKPVTTVIDGKEASVVPLTYSARSSGGSLTYYSTWHGKQTIYLKKAAD